MVKRYSHAACLPTAVFASLREEEQLTLLHTLQMAHPCR